MRSLVFSILPFGIGIALVLFPADVRALRYQERPPWTIGVGYGLGRGTLADPAGVKSDFRSGASTRIVFGRTLARRLSLDAEYLGWVIEFGNVPRKLRRSLQSLGAGVTFYPGNPEGPSGGIFLRAGAGLGWGAEAEVPVVEEEEQGHGERTDEYGIAICASSGYEFWISDHSCVGIALNCSYLDIGGTLIRDAWVVSTCATLTLAF